METKEEKTSIGRSIWSIIHTLFIIVIALGVIIGAIFFAVSKSPKKSIFGYRYYTVLTPSMEPTYKVGDLVFVKLSNAADINIGDVMTFNPSSETDAYLTHRVTEKYEDYEGSGVTCFKTKGDANKDEDGFLIDEARVIGKVTFSIPKLGYIIRFIQLKWYLVVPLVIMFFVFLRLVDAYLDAKDEDEDEEESSENTSEDNNPVESINKEDEIKSSEEADNEK